MSLSSSLKQIDHNLSLLVSAKPRSTESIELWRRHQTDAVAWVLDNQLLPSLDGWQQNVLTSPAQRSIWNLCRQSGKSTTAALISLHESIFEDSSVTLLVSPSLNQSSELFRKVKGFYDRLDDPPALVEDKATRFTLSNNSRVISLPDSEDTIRTYSANLIIEDESARVDDATYLACKPMLAVTGGRHVLMSTPKYQLGHFHEIWSNHERGDGWQAIMITAPQCPRISPEFLESERRSMPEDVFMAEYFGKFRGVDGCVFDPDLVSKIFRKDIVPLFSNDSGEDHNEGAVDEEDNYPASNPLKIKSIPGIKGFGNSAHE